MPITLKYDVMGMGRMEMEVRCCLGLSPFAPCWEMEYDINVYNHLKMSRILHPFLSLVHPDLPGYALAFFT